MLSEHRCMSLGEHVYAFPVEGTTRSGIAGIDKF